MSFHFCFQIADKKHCVDQPVLLRRGLFDRYPIGRVPVTDLSIAATISELAVHVNDPVLKEMLSDSVRKFVGVIREQLPPGVMLETSEL